MDFVKKEYYTETVEPSMKYKKMYLDSIHSLIKKSYEKAEINRNKYITPEKLSSNKEYYRKAYKKMIGIPDISGLPEVPEAKKEYIASDELCKFYRVSIETMSGFWFYGLLMIPHGIKTQVPIVIAQHGGGGTPEFCCDMYGENNYSNFSKRALEQGMVVFAPQLLLWKFDVDTGETFPEYDINYDREEIDDELKRFGLSITGLEVFSIMRCIDYLQTLDMVDKNKIGMMGLSYGGFFSLHTAAADARIKCVYDAASFNDRSKVALGDWRWNCDIEKFNEAEVAGLCSPRTLIIDVGKEDSVFDYRSSQAEAERAKAFYEYENAVDNFRYNLWDGGHRFDIKGGSMDKFFNGLK